MLTPFHNFLLCDFHFFYSLSGNPTTSSSTMSPSTPPPPSSSTLPPGGLTSQNDSGLMVAVGVGLGGLVGVLLILIALVVLCFMYRRRRERKSQRIGMHQHFCLSYVHLCNDIQTSAIWMRRSSTLSPFHPVTLRLMESHTPQWYIMRWEHI